jgi:hypothetical protein
MLTDANCAAPANTRIDITIAAVAPMTGSARTPNDMPIASVGSTNTRPALIPRVMSGGDTCKTLTPGL